MAGNRDAFGQIVARYQSLICSLAYSATGSFGQSEDLAQETFITAWKQLSHLRERDKLRAWLCGIARNRINSFLRREGREPVTGRRAARKSRRIASPEPLPVDYTISQEEEAILWRSLQTIPETYREPLVLFYREHQSVERVAPGAGIERGSRASTAVARAEIIAGTGAGVCGRRAGADNAGQGLHAGGHGLAAGAHLFRQGRDAGRRRQSWHHRQNRRTDGLVRRASRPAGRVFAQLYCLSRHPRRGRFG